MHTVGKYSKHIAIAALATMALSIQSCGNHGVDTDADETAQWPDTLRVATLYSPTSYFIYRDEPMGYDYSLLKQMAEEKGVVVDLKVASSVQKGIEMLDSGVVDLLAYEVPMTAEFRRRVVACGPEYLTHQVLVQPSSSDSTLIHQETELVGKDIYVPTGSKYQFRLENLNEELGGGIRIHTLEGDTLMAEDLIAMVSDGRIPLTVVDSDIAKINKTYYRDLDISLPLSFEQKSSWAVVPRRQWLADSIDSWFDQEQPRERRSFLLKKYFELSKGNSPEVKHLTFKNGHFSPFDAYFREAARESGIDWRLLAAQGYHESQFDTSRVSWAGARGIMQIMPGTARAFGLQDSEIEDPEKNIMTAALIMRDLNRSFAKKVPDAQERLKFMVAAYNSGIAHILDAIALAEKYGRNPQVWSDNVETALLMKSNPDYYSDPVCRAGYFRGRETVAYVNQVFDLFDEARKAIKR